MIVFEGVTKRYGGTLAVEDFSLEVGSHSLVALVGSSGSGKTTLLRMVNRLVEPTAGRVLVDGRDVRDQDPVALRRSIGYVLQHGGLLPHRDVLDNASTVPVLNGATRASARAAGLAALERVGLDASMARRYPHELSGGQQQRVGVARALAADPDVLLMDEPFGAVDPVVRRELQDELRRIQRDLAKTILFVTHDLDEAFRLADRIVILREGGRIAQQGTPLELVTTPADAFVRRFVGSDRADRELRLEHVDGVTVAVDGEGRPVGLVR